jgi:hypothetical protein
MKQTELAGGIYDFAESEKRIMRFRGTRAGLQSAGGGLPGVAPDKGSADDGSPADGPKPNVVEVADQYPKRCAQ